MKQALSVRRPWARATGMLALSLTVIGLGGCGWVGLAKGALTYPTTQAGEAANVVAGSDWAYVTRGAAGIEILHLGTTVTSTRVLLPAGFDSADDLALADNLLFVLDATPPGHLGVFSLEQPSAPKLLGTPIPVDVGPFSGVTAAGGHVIVSGGTSLLTVRRYYRDGRMSSDAVTADFGRGQPDALLTARGDLALVSTHSWGPYFRLTLAQLQAHTLTELGSVPLDTYGFTPGGAKPANFPVEVAVAGRIACIASVDGLQVVDIGTPARPRVLARLKLDIEPVNVDVRDGVAALVGSKPQPKLVFVDVRDAARPKVLQSYPLPEGSLATGVALTRTHAVIAAHGKGSLLFDRSKSEWAHIQPTTPLYSFNQGALP